MRALAAVQTELAPTIGYDGADGYVQLQVALMEHLADPAVAHATQALLELIEIAPGVAAVRAAAGEIDVGEEEHVALDPEPAVTSRVAGQVDGLGRARGL